MHRMPDLQQLRLLFPPSYSEQDMKNFIHIIRSRAGPQILPKVYCGRAVSLDEAEFWEAPFPRTVEREIANVAESG